MSEIKGLLGKYKQHSLSLSEIERLLSLIPALHDELAVAHKEANDFRALANQQRKFNESAAVTTTLDQLLEVFLRSMEGLELKTSAPAFVIEEVFRKGLSNVFQVLTLRMVSEATLTKALSTARAVGPYLSLDSVRAVVRTSILNANVGIPLDPHETEVTALREQIRVLQEQAEQHRNEERAAVRLDDTRINQYERAQKELEVLTAAFEREVKRHSQTAVELEQLREKLRETADAPNASLPSETPYMSVRPTFYPESGTVDPESTCITLCNAFNDLCMKLNVRAT